ncbi:BamA/TamA family outer membrane protein [Halosquirtibacter laminarini]|uniref:BamA/TamA family outer membrane protein n=1 Tax=Halosquirtibacter laminarini TaxID=3374600 RepID=A0AC61NBS2_9BACT|nr:BamA/TamA family outer membrane protein [Prolixibacteraceae bacterium]
MRKVVFIFLFFVSIFYGLAQEQDTIKSKKLIDKTTHLVSKTLDKVTFTHPKYTFSLYPMAGFGPQYGFQVGLMPVFRFLPKEQPDSSSFYRPTTLIPSFMVSTQGQYSFEIDFLMFTDNRWLVMSNIRIEEVPNKYYGISNNNSEVTPTDYTYINNSWRGEVSKGLTDEFFLGLRFNIVQTKNNLDLDSESDVVPLDSSVYGYDGGFTLGLGPVVRYDSRDDILFPSKGFFGTTYFLAYPNASFNDYHFMEWKTDLRYYYPLKSKNRVMAFQLMTDLEYGDVPFYLMSKLGGKYALRGIEHPFRYIDKNVWFARAEYRQMFKNRFGFTVFSGLGNEFGSNDTKAFKDIKFVYGAGLRFKILPDDNLNFRADIGFGPHGQNSIYLTVLEAF